MDSLLGYLLSEIKKLPIFSNINLFVLSDHGMVDINLDKIIVLDKGEIIERGTHNQLLEKKGYYHKINKSQTKKQI